METANIINLIVIVMTDKKKKKKKSLYYRHGTWDYTPAPVGQSLEECRQTRGLYLSWSDLGLCRGPVGILSAKVGLSEICADG